MNMKMSAELALKEVEKLESIIAPIIKNHLAGVDTIVRIHGFINPTRFAFMKRHRFVLHSGIEEQYHTAPEDVNQVTLGSTEFHEKLMTINEFKYIEEFRDDAQDFDIDAEEVGGISRNLPVITSDLYGSQK